MTVGISREKLLRKMGFFGRLSVGAHGAIDSRLES